MEKQNIETLTELKQFCESTDQMVAYNELVRSFSLGSAYMKAIKKIMPKSERIRGVHDGMITTKKIAEFKLKDIEKEILSVSKEIEKLNIKYKNRAIDPNEKEAIQKAIKNLKKRLGRLQYRADVKKSQVGAIQKRMEKLVEEYKTTFIGKHISIDPL